MRRWCFVASFELLIRMYVDFWLGGIYGCIWVINEDILQLLAKR